ncbi:hypothetical protein DPSP01_007156 [Paraphaeosphaeria sporulosa]
MIASKYPQTHEEEEKWRGPWVLHCMLERYGLDFQFVVWMGEEEEEALALKNFFVNVWVMEEICHQGYAKGREKRKQDVDDEIERLLQWQPALS